MSAKFLYSLLKVVFLGALLLVGTGCQLPYYAKSAYHQAKILAAREDITSRLKQNNLTAQEKHKLQLASEAREFAKTKLGLNDNGNYTQFVQLDRPYVSWVVNASEKWQLKHYHFDYLIVGQMPYKGYFSEEEAQAEKSRLEAKGLDVYLRGVSAYSTLGWFKDPVLSSMLRYEDHDLVNTIIHELVHSTLYIKNSADFNERMAVFIGNLGTEMFYKAKDGPDSATLKKIKQEYYEEELFSQFISKELKSLDDFYQQLPKNQRTEEIKDARLQEIKVRFKTELRPKLSENSFKRFESSSFNNAYLILFKTYNQDLDQFKTAFLKLNSDLSEFLKVMKGFEKEKDPLAALQKFNAD